MSLFISLDLCSRLSATIEINSLPPSVNVNLLLVYVKLYLFKIGEFFNDKKLSSFRSFGFFSIKSALFLLIILEKANFLSSKIPKSFLISHDSIFVKDKDFIGLKYIKEIIQYI